MTTIFSILIGAALFGLIISFKDAFTPRMSLKERIERLQSAHITTASLLLEDESNKRSLEQIINNHLEGSGIRIKLSELVGVSVGSGMTLFILIGAATGDYTVATLFMIATAIAIPYFLIIRRRNKRLQQIDDQLAQSLGIMSQAIQSGHSTQQAFQILEEEMDPPIKEEFARINRDLSLGEPLHVVLTNFKERIPSQDIDLFVSAVLISQQTGGRLNEVLDNIAATIRSRVALKREIAAKTATSRMSATILTLAPMVMFLLLYTMNPAYMKPLLTDPIGQLLLITAICLNVFGGLVNSKLVKVEGLDPRMKRRFLNIGGGKK